MCADKKLLIDPKPSNCGLGFTYNRENPEVEPAPKFYYTCTAIPPCSYVSSRCSSILDPFSFDNIEIYNESSIMRAETLEIAFSLPNVLSFYDVAAFDVFSFLTRLSCCVRLCHWLGLEPNVRATWERWRRNVRWSMAMAQPKAPLQMGTSRLATSSSLPTTLRSSPAPNPWCCCRNWRWRIWAFLTVSTYMSELKR